MGMRIAQFMGQWRRRPHIAGEAHEIDPGQILQVHEERRHRHSQDLRAYPAGAAPGATPERGRSAERAVDQAPAERIGVNQLRLQGRGEYNLDQNNDAQRARQRWPAPAEFARMSSSMKLTTIAILRAQMSSRRAVEAAASAKRPDEDDS